MWCCDLPLKARALALAKTTKFAENRDAAALGGLKLASAATPPSSVCLASKTPAFIGSKPPPEPDRAWRQATVQVRVGRANEAIAENHEKNRTEAPSVRRRKMVAPRVGTCPESAMVHGNEADEIRISHSNTRALSFVCKIVELSTCRRA